MTQFERNERDRLLALLTRREFFSRLGMGAGAMALAALLADQTEASAVASPQKYDLTLRPPHFRAQAKRVIYLFQNGGPSKVDLSTQSNAHFTQGASGQPVILRGNAGILVTITTADEHTAYGGPTDIKTNYTVLVEARQVQDFEGTVQWGLGLSKAACYRAFFIANQVRLVIDVQNS